VAKKKSTIVPFLVASLTCDVAVPDPTTGKKNLIGVFNKLFVRSFPASRPLWVYVKISDAEGFYGVRVRVVHSKTSHAVCEATGELTVNNRLESFDFLVPVYPFIATETGRYEFQIWMNDNLIGTPFIDVVTAAGSADS